MSKHERVIVGEIQVGVLDTFDELSILDKKLSRG